MNTVNALSLINPKRIDSQLDKIQSLDGHEVHIWYSTITHLAERTDDFYLLLDQHEKKRVEATTSKHAKQKIIVSRGFLRDRLSQYLQTPAANLQFTLNQHQKPLLKHQHAISFNVSHCEDIMVIAITKQKTIGIDIEKINKKINFQKIMQRYFSEKQYAEYQRLEPQQQSRFFFLLWTQLESQIKAEGCSLLSSLNTFQPNPNWQTHSFELNPQLLASVTAPDLDEITLFEK